MEEVSEYRKQQQDNLLSLPNELLVYIFAFLPSARDKLMLKYVSRRLQSVMETLSLWSEFVWPCYDIREDRCVNNLLKSFGGHIKRLSFPDHVPSSLLKMLPYCTNVMDLNLATAKLNPDQLVMATKHMNQLQTLEVQWNTDLMQFVYILLSIKTAKLKELTVRVKTKEKDLSNVHSSLRSLLYWLTKGIMPVKFNIICSCFEEHVDLIEEWSRCNLKSPSGHNGTLKIYTSLKVPLDLYPALPVFQMLFGQEATLPYVHASKLGLLGFENKLILLTSRYQANTIVYRAKMKMWKSGDDFQGYWFNSDFKDLSSIVECDFSACTSLQSDHLEQLAVLCPNLQRLNLSHNNKCLKNLQRLRTIAKCCLSLKGLNLSGIKITEVEDDMQLWEILSDMKLTHLAIELCIINLVKGDRQSLIRLYGNCSHLQVLHLQSSICHNCNVVTDQDVLLISNFPSLTYCMLSQTYQTALIVQGIVTSCTGLKCLNFSSSFPLSFSVDINACCLQQLCLHSTASSIPDNFMVAISAQHTLVHMLLCVKLVGCDGVAAVIENSPKLITFHIIAHVSTTEGLTLRPNDLKTVMKKKYSNTRLCNSGSFEVEVFLSHRSKELLELDLDVTSYLWS